MISKIAVIGSGLMGNGIALTCVQAGFSVTNVDLSKAALEKAQSATLTLYEKKIAKGSLTPAQKDEYLKRLTFSNNLNDIKDASLIIEAVPENIDLKKTVFKELDDIANPDAIIISNTSGLSISEIASATKRPSQIMGAHFFYPAPVMKLLELIRGLQTSDETYNFVKEFALAIGKEVVEAPEYPGFIVNRLLVLMQNEAAFLVMEGCQPEDVDKAMKLGTNHPMGPLELADFVGVDIVYATITSIYSGFKDSKYRPCPLLENMVKAGYLGRKSGRGFYNYTTGGIKS